MSKPQVIVYGYNASPFYQKLLGVLAVLRVEHAICATPPVMPRPMLSDELGITYRRIPVLAIDGEVYCDTSIAIEELDARFGGKPGHGKSLFAVHGTLQKRLVAHWSDREVFMLAAGLIPLKALSKEFLEDRKGFAAAPIGKASPAHAKSQLLTHLASLETMLSESPSQYLLGTETPQHLDLGAAFALHWLRTGLRAVPELLPLDGNGPYPKVLAWLSAVDGYVNSCRSGKAPRIGASDAADAIARAGAAAVQKVQGGAAGVSASDPTGLKKGDVVEVTPRDSGRVPQRGVLMVLSDQRITLRVDGKRGPVLVQFPRAFFDVQVPKEQARL